MPSGWRREPWTFIQNGEGASPIESVPSGRDPGAKARVDESSTRSSLIESRASQFRLGSTSPRPPRLTFVRAAHGRGCFAGGFARLDCLALVALLFADREGELGLDEALL